MSELLTTRQLQDILKVDRTTIYRMVNSGQLPAIRVGNQWRFPREGVERWLAGQAMGGGPPAPASATPRVQGADDDWTRVFPLECVQQIQDAFADALGVMIIVTDLHGRSITRPSNPPGLYTAVDAAPEAHRRCIELWVRMAQNPTLRPRFTPSHLGLLCARGLVRVGLELKAMVVLGGIAPEGWPPGEEELAEIAASLGVPVAVLEEHLDEVHRLSPEEQERVLPFVQRIADIMAHIVTERQAFLSRLQQIAELTAV